MAGPPARAVLTAYGEMTRRAERQLVVGTGPSRTAARDLERSVGRYEYRTFSELTGQALNECSTPMLKTAWLSLGLPRRMAELQNNFRALSKSGFAKRLRL